MITLLHTKDNYKKKNFDIYKELLKETSRTIKKIPLEDIIQIDTFFHHETYKSIGKLALLFYSHKEGSGYSKIKKEIKKMYKEYGLNTFIDLYLYFTYAITERAHVLTEYGEEIANELTRYSVKDSISTYFNIETLISSLALIIIILENDLLNYGISHFQDINGELKLIKDTKKDTFSIIKGCYNNNNEFVYGTIGLISSKDFNLYKNRTIDIVDNYNHLDSNNAKILCAKDFLKLKTVITYNYYQLLLTKMIYLDEYFKNNKYVNESFLDSELCYLKSNVLKTRKFLPPKGGIILKINNSSNIESIYLNESEFNEDRVIVGTVRYTDKTESIFSLVLPVRLFNIVTLRHLDEVIDILLDFYGIEDGDSNKKFEYEVLSPYYWKYRDNNYETKNEKKDRIAGKKVKREYEVKISSFIRKINGNPSNEALSLAEKLCIELKPNTTIVKEHTRTYGKTS